MGRPRGGYSRGEIRGRAVPACGARRLLLLLSVDTVAARVRARLPPLLSFSSRRVLGYFRPHFYGACVPPQ